SVRELGPEGAPPGLMSLTIAVPPAVPSHFHSSSPLIPSSAVKKRVPFALVRPAPKGLIDRVLPPLTSFTIAVPAAVPSLFHSSPPVVPVEAVTKRVPFAFLR